MAHNALLQKLDPDSNGLMAALSKHVDDEMLLEIAGADWGMYTDLYLIDLQKIRDKGSVPIPLSWSPREVLNLMKSDDLIKGDEISRASDIVIRHHLLRAFVCAALLQSSEDPLNQEFFNEEVTALGSLLDSLPILDGSIQAEGLRFFAWRAGVLPEFDSESPFWLIGLLVMVLRLHAPLTSAELNELITWLDHNVDRLRHHPWMLVENNVERNDQWLTWLTYYKRMLKIWQEIGQEIALIADQPEYADNRQALKDLASHLETI